ncbi:MAG: hypothetical protein PHE78_05825 [Candidatus Gastranaerophilales bacterium]|nr:hypothetical protein [Candidatus Gastranaerophilales bacterium]
MRVRVIVFIFIALAFFCEKIPCCAQTVEPNPLQEVIMLPAQEEKTVLPSSTEGLLRIQPEVQPPLGAQVEQNIFNKSFKKTFATGIVKDISLITSHDSIYSLLSENGGPTHNLFNNATSLYGFQGHFRDDSQYYLSFMPFRNIEGYENVEHWLFEYYVKRPLNEHNKITIGQQRNASGLEGSHSIFGLETGRRSLFASKCSNITAIGTKISGDYDKFDYQAGVFDTGRFLKNNFDSAPEFSGMVNFKPIKNTQKYGKIKAGTSYTVGNRDAAYSVCTGHILYDYKKAHVDFEYAYADGYNAKVNKGDKAKGYYATFVYDITPKIKAFYRFDTLDPNTRLAGQAISEYTTGLHYYIKGNKARVTLSYVYADYESKPDSNRLFSMFELIL